MVRNTDNCQQISQNVISIRNAVIEDVVIDKRHMIATISYQVLENRRSVKRILCLIISGNTVLNTQSQNTASMRQIRPGIKMNALVCSEMSQSTPAQTKAYCITILEEEKKQPLSHTGRIISVDWKNQSFLVGLPWNRNGQINFIVSRNTVILNSDHKRISLRQLTPGLNVKVEHSGIQTFSVPPQAKAYQVYLL